MNYVRRVKRVRAALGNAYDDLLKLAEYLDRELPRLRDDLGDAEVDVNNYNSRQFDCRQSGHWWMRVPFEGVKPMGSGLPPESFHCNRCDMGRVDVIAAGGWVQRRIYLQPNGYKLSATLYRSDFRLLQRERGLLAVLKLVEES